MFTSQDMIRFFGFDGDAIKRAENHMTKICIYIDQYKRGHRIVKDYATTQYVIKRHYDELGQWSRYIDDAKALQDHYK